MSIVEPTYGEVYDQLLALLRNVGANELAREIERTVARGVVLAGQETDLYQSSSVFRQMEDREALAVGLEFLVTASEVPLMLAAAHHVLGDKPLEWRPERPGTEREEVAIPPASQVDQQGLRALLLKVIEIAKELGINMPEIA